MSAGGRTREYQMKVAEPEPGRILTESDTGCNLVTTITVLPRGGASLVQISTAWDGAGEIGGVFERMFAPRVMRAIYTDELKQLEPTRANTALHEPTTLSAADAGVHAERRWCIKIRPRRRRLSLGQNCQPAEELLITARRAAVLIGKSACDGEV